MSVSLQHLSLEAVIAESGISRATAYRHWPSKAEFLREVLVQAVRTTQLESETPAEIADLANWLGERVADLSTAQGRRNLVVEALRRASEADVRRVLRSPSWQTYLAIAATCRGLPAGPLRDDVERALAQTDARFTARRALVYARLADLIGYRLTPPLQAPEGFAIMADAAGAMMTGLLTVAAGQQERAWGASHTIAFGSSEAADWTLPTRHLVGVVLAHLEPDPAVEWDETRRAATVESTRALLATLEDEARNPESLRSP